MIGEITQERYFAIKVEMDEDGIAGSWLQINNRDYLVQADPETKKLELYLWDGARRSADDDGNVYLEVVPIPEEDKRELKKVLGGAVDL